MLRYGAMVAGTFWNYSEYIWISQIGITNYISSSPFFQPLCGLVCDDSRPRFRQRKMLIFIFVYHRRIYIFWKVLNSASNSNWLPDAQKTSIWLGNRTFTFWRNFFIFTKKLQEPRRAAFWLTELLRASLESFWSILSNFESYKTHRINCTHQTHHIDMVKSVLLENQEISKNHDYPSFPKSFNFAAENMLQNPD